MDVHSPLARAAIDRDLACYADQWQCLQQLEVESAHGPVCPVEAVKLELARSGKCVHAVTLRRGDDCIEATWDGDSGRHLVAGARVVISREHPRIDALRSFTVKYRTGGRLHLRPARVDGDIEDGTWRLDLEAHYVPYYRVSKCLHCFSTVEPSTTPSPLQVLIGSYLGTPQQRRAMNEATGQPAAIHFAALSSLNDSQRRAVARSLAQRVLPIQGPPGTGKTQVAEAIFAIWQSIGGQGPFVGAAPSNVAADNLTRRLMRARSLNVRRYGPPDKITDAVVRTISSQNRNSEQGNLI